MNEVMTAPEPVVPVMRKCRFEEVFDANFVELLRLVPCNAQVRALILKLTGRLPGPEWETFEQLKDWVELNCVKRVLPSPAQSGRRNQDDGISINVEFADREYGRADYSVRRTGSGTFRIGAANLVEMVQEAIDDGEGIDKVVESVASKIDEDAWGQCDPDMNDTGDYDYCEHESSDTGDSDTTINRSDVRSAVLAFIRERHPELAAEL